MARYDNIVETIGRTPVVRLHALVPPEAAAGVELYVKLEARNPGGSVKDRLALGVIEAAERSGALRPGQTVVEATSGNTGIGLAVVCAQRGYPLVIVMSENFSVERRKIMRFLGAQVILTPAADRGMGMLLKAQELAEAHGWFFARQFENEANAEIHARTTAVEILEDFPDGLDYWVTGFGTGGTLQGVARVLKARTPATKVIVCEPDNSQVYASAVRVPWPADGVPRQGHPEFSPHPVQGWAPDFVPKLAEDARKLVDEIVPVSGKDALALPRELARREGIFTGISGGATLAGALAIARRAQPGARILCMLPDTGERYQSTPLFADVSAEMNEAELAIANSTPSARFDRPGATAAAAPPPLVGASDRARAFVAQALADRAQPVVLFALEWCEFCWAVRKLFTRCNIAYRSVDIDAIAYKPDHFGNQIRAALCDHSGMRTIPQVFVAGQLIGGTSETFAAFAAGTLQTQLTAAGVAFEDKIGDQLYALLPGWVQRR